MIDLTEIAFDTFTPAQQKLLSPSRLHTKAMRTWDDMRIGLIHAWAADLHLALGTELGSQAERAWEMLVATGIYFWDEPGSEPYEDVGLSVAYAISTLWFLARERHLPALPTEDDCRQFLGDSLRGLPMFREGIR